MSKLAPVLAAVAALGIVGGVAAAQAFQPTAKPAQVQFVQPAAEVAPVTVAPTVTATTVAPKPVAKPKPAPKPVATVNSVAPAPAPVQTQEARVAVQPEPVATTPAASKPTVAADDPIRQTPPPPIMPHLPEPPVTPAG